MSRLVRLHRVDETDAAYRYYELEVLSETGDLFGSSAVRRRYGRIGETPQERLQYFETVSEANAYLDKKLKEKLSRGYEIVDSDAGRLRRDKCFFCRMLEDPKSDPCFVMTLSSSTLVVGWDQSYAGRSILVLNKHIPDFFRVSHHEILRLLSDVKASERLIRSAFKPDMMNYLFMGNVTQHAHLHLVPRYVSDPNFGRSPFLDTTRVEAPSLSDSEYRAIADKVRSGVGAPTLETES